MVSVDQSLFLQIMNFLVLVWILNLVLYKPIRGVLIDRKQKIEVLESTINACDQVIVDKYNAYEFELKNARLTGQKQKEALIEAALNEEKEIISEINDRALVELKEAKEKIRTEIDQVRHSLEGEVNIFATEIGKKLLGRSL